MSTVSPRERFKELGEHILSKKRCHIIGIGGVSMSPLAQILHNTGVEVTGSDISENAATNELRGCGVKINIGHDAGNVTGAGYIIRTAAAREDNVEIAAAREQNIPIFERAEVWGYIMRDYKDAICISGAHGKTTTTSMVSHILLAAKKDPTIMIGGTLPEIKASYRVGKGDVIVLESCEYYNSFHNFSPTIAVVLNIDEDHLDFFKDLDDIKQSFCKFAAITPPYGAIICNGDDENTMDALSSLGRELVTFGLGEYSRITNKPINVRGVNISVSGLHPSMDVLVDGKLAIQKLTLSIPGKHNLLNALAATVACFRLGIPPTVIKKGMLTYTGSGRRFEYKGSYNGADIYDDYAHHPHELEALLDAVATIDTYKRVILAFQPHTYSRTKALFEGFTEQLERADIVFLAEIYAARETNTIGISSADLAKAVDKARFIPDFAELVSEIAAIAQEGDIILTVGAGDIYKVSTELLKKK